MYIETTTIEGLLVIKPDVFGDSRGYFQETWNKKKYTENGLDVYFTQDNLSYSTKGILRGLHFQNPNPQSKLVHVPHGEVFDVAVDIRYGSPTFGDWFGIFLSDKNHYQLYIPEGFAHGFCVTSETALFSYKCSGSYYPEFEYSIAWNDPDIRVNWPISFPRLSTKDMSGMKLSEIDVEVFKFK